MKVLIDLSSEISSLVESSSDRFEVCKLCVRWVLLEIVVEVLLVVGGCVVAHRWLVVVLVVVVALDGEHDHVG